MADSTYRRAVTHMSAKGYRTDESAFGDLGPPEEPMLLRRAVELVQHSGMNIDQLAEMVGLSADRIATFVESDLSPSVEFSS